MLDIGSGLQNKSKMLKPDPDQLKEATCALLHEDDPYIKKRDQASRHIERNNYLQSNRGGIAHAVQKDPTCDLTIWYF